MTTLQGLIREAVNNTSCDVEFYSGYRGRGMYGRQCIGITGSMQECMEVIGDVIIIAHNSPADDDVDFEDYVRSVMNFKTDSMGMDMIVYWEELEPEVEEPGHSVASFYEDGVCPDCGEVIPRNAVDGSECKNCGHVFTTICPVDDIV